MVIMERADKWVENGYTSKLLRDVLESIWVIAPRT